ncbi:MAG TPA: methionyl-tRNA formyltransferase [Planctomycetes bacterium]|nr:methionyl-tRNA formyltransferase [Planctomycetota bacterium]
MRIVFLGTSSFGAKALEGLLGGPHEPALVVTQPDRPAGRGRSLKSPPVKDTAEAAGIAVFQPEKVNTRAARARIREAAPDALVVVAFGQILRPLLLALPPLGCFNLHASLLPRHRGASPIQAQILHGDDPVGVTVMKLDEGMDTGPIALQGTLPALPDETAGALHDRLALLGRDLLPEALNLLERGALTLRPQDETLATHAPILRKSDGLLDFRESAQAVARRIRAFDPWPGNRVRVRDDGALREWALADVAVAEEASGAPGAITVTAEGRLLITCGKGGLLVGAVTPRARRRMTVRAYLNGSPLSPRARCLMPEEPAEP